MPWASNDDLPKSVQGLPDGAKSIFRAAANSALKDGKSDADAMKIGWGAVKNAGYHKDGDSWVKKKDARELVKFDDKRSKIPFEYEDSALAKLRPDQIPRMLGAITHPELNDVVHFEWDNLVAIQNRIDTERVEDIATGTDDGSPAGIVAKFSNKNYILDGHHRMAGRWLRGDDGVDAYFINLQPMSNAMKHAKVLKVDETLGVVFGWAIVCKEDGEDYYDTQDHHIPEDVMLKAAHDAAPHIVGGDMHVWTGDPEDDSEAVPVQKGDITFMFPLTTDIAKAMGLSTSVTGLMIGYKPHDLAILQKFKDGTYTGFSIGGRANMTEEPDA